MVIEKAEVSWETVGQLSWRKKPCKLHFNRYNKIMNKREFTAVYQKKGKWLVAWVEEVPGANTQGRTINEARENLKEALQLVLETNRSLSEGRGIDARRESLRIAVPV